MTTPSTLITADMPEYPVYRLVLRRLRWRFPVLWFSARLKVAASDQMQGIVSFVSTIGLGLDASKQERFHLTFCGVLRPEVMEGYYFRLPVLERDRAALERALVEALRRLAVTGAADTASASLIEESGELVVIGEHVPGPRTLGTPRPITVL